MLPKETIKLKRTTYKGEHWYKVIKPIWNGMTQWFNRQGYETKHHAGHLLIRLKNRAYIVNYKDLVNQKKNPGFKLGARAILMNPRIKKTPFKR